MSTVGDSKTKIITSAQDFRPPVGEIWRVTAIKTWATLKGSAYGFTIDWKDKKSGFTAPFINSKGVLGNYTGSGSYYYAREYMWGSLGTAYLQSAATLNGGSHVQTAMLDTTIYQYSETVTGNGTYPTTHTAYQGLQYPNTSDKMYISNDFYLKFSGESTASFALVVAEVVADADSGVELESFILRGAGSVTSKPGVGETFKLLGYMAETGLGTSAKVTMELVDSESGAKVSLVGLAGYVSGSAATPYGRRHKRGCFGASIVNGTNLPFTVYNQGYQYVKYGAAPSNSDTYPIDNVSYDIPFGNTCYLKTTTTTTSCVMVAILRTK